MANKSLATNTMCVIKPDQLGNLFAAIEEKGHVIVGPIVHEGAIVLKENISADDLPAGWSDVQEPGKYRLKKRPDKTIFGYANGPNSWKPFLYPPKSSLLKVRRSGTDFEVIEEKVEAPKYAFIGVRPCELAAILIQDKILMDGEYKDPTYKERRENALICVVNCLNPGGTCFCASMKTGPKAESGFDLALTEVAEGDKHYFLVEVGSEKGGEILGAIKAAKAGEEEVKAADNLLAKAAGKMGRKLETADLKELLYRNYENPHWEDIAERCLNCGNCTNICPTCFCSTVLDYTDLTGSRSERVRTWYWCFSVEYAYIFGGSTRTTPRSRYRQWLTHKLGTWIDQFDTPGCVGCGRCITWCPVGIDITDEADKIRETEKAAKAAK
jgi:sulfhydrogenase subunit beta (sulfur reductase)